MLAFAVLVAGVPVLAFVVPKNDTALNVAAIPVLVASVASLILGALMVGEWRWWGRGLLLIAVGPLYILAFFGAVLEVSGVGT
jgi:hypothetical protein